MIIDNDYAYNISWSHFGGGPKTKHPDLGESNPKNFTFVCNPSEWSHLL